MELPLDEPVITIRRLTAADDPVRLRALRLEMLADTPIAFADRLSDAQLRPPSYWRDRLERSVTDPSRVLFVVEEAEQWVGQAGGHVDAAGRANLVSVYIAPPHRGTGLLERLAARVFAWARERGCGEICLEVAVENRRAVAAYRRLGFAPNGRSQPHPIYPEVSSEIEMCRAL